MPKANQKELEVRKMEAIRAKLENPNMSILKLEAKTGIPKSTLHRWFQDSNIIIDSMDKNIKDKAEQLIDILDCIIEDGNRVIRTYLPTLEVNTYDDLNKISSIQERAWKQSQIIRGKETERKIIDITSMSEDDRNKYIAESIKTPVK